MSFEPCSLRQSNYGRPFTLLAQQFDLRSLFAHEVSVVL